MASAAPRAIASQRAAKPHATVTSHIKSPALPPPITHAWPGGVDLIVVIVCAVFALAASIFACIRKLRAGILTVVIAVIVAGYGIAASHASSTTPLWPPDWVWFSAIILVGALESFVIQREGGERDKTVRDTIWALSVMLDRSEAAVLADHLTIELPIRRQSLQLGIMSKRQKEIFGMADRLFYIAKLRLASQPRLQTERDIKEMRAFVNWASENARLYNDGFRAKVDEARAELAAEGLKGQPYEEAAYESPTILANMFRIADLLSTLAISVQSVEIPAKE